jgi:pimeloyl-ACP methyl ester carboxylesterase
MVDLARQKSTIVRFRFVARRATFHALDLLAPRVAGRQVRDLWFTLPPAVAAAPLPPGGAPFRATSRGIGVRGHSWGEGPVVYLVHGWGGRGTQFVSFVEPLVAAGHTVVMYDAPSHGSSDAGPHGRRTHGVEAAQALDEVSKKFGPARAVIAHSMGAIVTNLAINQGWLGAERLVLISPMANAVELFDGLQAAVGFGARTRRAFERGTLAFTGLPVEEFDTAHQASLHESIPTLAISDRQDPQASYASVVRLAAELDAPLVATDGLGHNRILRDESVVRDAVGFVVDRRAVVAA